MATNCIVLVVLALTCLSEVSFGGEVEYEEAVRDQCWYTRYPTLCVETLMQLGSSGQSVDFVSALVNKTIAETKMPDSYVGSLDSSSISPDSELIRTATDDCEELMEMSLKRLNQAMELLQNSPTEHKDDIQTWLSAALTYQETCRDTITEVSSDAYMAEVYKKMDHLSELGSNSLAMANLIPENPPMGRRLLERGDFFPRWVSASERKLLQTTEVKANAVVAKDGSGDFETVEEAINAATGGRFVIYVKAGTYNEKISTNKDGITLIGDGKYDTVITAGSSVGKGASLRGSATFTVHGDGFIARDIGFENTAGAEGHQAIALAISSDRSVVYRCSLAGYQDTLYALSLRQFYRECDIYGTIDFIFGNAVAVFQSCNIIFRQRRSGASFNAILANGRSDPGQNTGFSVHNSKITGSGSACYLGRPWKAYSRAVVMQSNIDGSVSPRGWYEWEGAAGSTYKTLYFGEYGNMGAGAATSGRVSWPGFHVMATSEASKFTVGNFIAGNSWLPSTGVTYVSGL